jgi:hypothetical protein
LNTELIFKWHLKTGPDFKWLNHLKTKLEKSGFQMFQYSFVEFSDSHCMISNKMAAKNGSTISKLELKKVGIQMVPDFAHV